MWQELAIRAGIGLYLWGINKLVEWQAPKGRPIAWPIPDALKLPMAGKGTTVPLVYGSVKLETPPIYWAGNHYTNTWEGVTYQRIDLLLGAGIPACRNIPGHDWYTLETPPRLMAIWINGRRMALGAGGVGIAHGESHSTSGLTGGGFFLGGTGAGGWFYGTVEFYDGRDGQDLAVSGSHYRAALENANLGIPIDPNYVPGYARQMCVAIVTSPGWNPALPLQPGMLGEGDSLVSIALEVQALGTEAILTNGEYYEANPAYVLLDLLGGDVWKLGMNLSLIDVTSFEDCGELLATEGFGMSTILAQSSSSQALFSELLDTLNAIIFKHHLTGKLTMRLIRDDYDPDDIPVLDFSNTVGDPEVQFIGWDNLVNQVDVEFTDRTINWVKNLATAQRGATAVGQNFQIRSVKASHRAITSPTVARTVAARDLGVLGRPRMTAVAKVKQSLHAVGYGDAVKANWVNDDGVICQNKIFRVVGVDHGTLEDGTITLELIEDVFNATEGGLPPWSPPWGSDPPFEIPEQEEFDPWIG